MSEANTSSLLRQKRLKEPLAIEVAYRGGPCSSWVIRFRGVYRTFEGYLSLDDVLQALYAERWAVKTPKRRKP